MPRGRLLKLLFATGIPVILAIIPIEWISSGGLSLVEYRLVLVFALAVLFWILEPVPIYATSILVIVLLLLLVSDHNILPDTPRGEIPLGDTIAYDEIMGVFGSPIIMLFLGGFFLARAVNKIELDVNLANYLLRPFGTRPKFVMLGIMIITAVFSMFMSNTATAAMMITILIPVVSTFRKKRENVVAFGLALAFSANIGGIGTIIGTPPNAIGIGFLEGDDAIGYGQWMLFALPFVVVMLAFLWILLQKMYPIHREEVVELKTRVRFRRSREAMIVYFTFPITVILWLLDFVHGMNAYIVAMIPVAVFSVTSVIDKNELRKMRWDILWLIAGGQALGLAIDRTGLSHTIIEAVPLEDYAPLVVVAVAAVIPLVLSNFISNTATANLFLPIMVALGASMPQLVEVGGIRFIILVTTFACSLGMAMPISTPPNALSHGSRLVRSADMMKVGAIVGLVGIALAFAYLYFLTAVTGLL